MATPALCALRARLPGVRIVYACRPYVRGLLDGLPWHDGLVVGEGGRLGLIRGLRKERCDAALLLTPSFGSALEAWAAGIQRRIGLASGGRSLLLTDRVETFPHPVYMGTLYRRLAGAVLGGDVEPGAMELPCTEAQEANASKLWRDLGLEGERVVGLVPGASYGSSKCWPPSHFADLARRILAELGARVLLLHGPGEEGIAAEILRGAPGVLAAGPEKAGLGDLKAVVKRLAVAVTNDTGPRHLAEAAGIPVVALVGPMDPRYTESGNPRVLALREPVDCSPCGLRTCPIDHRCLTRITPERVMVALGGLLV